MTRKNCSVVNCKQNQLQLPLHLFPKENLNPTRFKTWLDACGDPALYKIDKDKISGKYFICHRHFEKKFITRQSRLFKIAVPTVHLGPKVKASNSNEDCSYLQTENSGDTAASKNQTKSDAKNNQKPKIPQSNEEPVILKTRKNIVKVFGSDMELKKPTIIRSLLEKARLPNEGNVYVLPVRGKVDFHKLENKNIDKIVTVNTLGKNIKQLLNVTHASQKRFKKTISERKRMCTCTVHCCKQNYVKTRVNSGISTRVEGQLCNDLSNDKALNPDFQNSFSVSTILTNVNDKHQVEQLCQLLIESIFRLKHINVEGLMGRLTVYLTQHSNIDHSRRNENIFSSDSNSSPENISENYSNIIEKELSESQKNLLSSNVILGSENTECPSQNKSLNGLTGHSETPEKLSPHLKQVDLSPNLNKMHVEVDLNAIHDHSYLSLDSKFLLEKPDFLVNLIDIKKYKSSKKKSRILKPPPVVHPRKRLIEFSKLNDRIFHLKNLLRKKNENIKLLNRKIKYLGDIVRSEKGVKRLRFPKEKLKCSKEEWPYNEVSFNQHYETSGDSPFKENKTSSDKKNKCKQKNLPDGDIPLLVDYENRRHFCDLNSETLSESMFDRFDDFYHTFPVI